MIRSDCLWNFCSCCRSCVEARQGNEKEYYRQTYRSTPNHFKTQRNDGSMNGIHLLLVVIPIRLPSLQRGSGRQIIWALALEAEASPLTSQDLHTDGKSTTWRPYVSLIMSCKSMNHFSGKKKSVAQLTTDMLVRHNDRYAAEARDLYDVGCHHRLSAYCRVCLCGCTCRGL